IRSRVRTALALLLVCGVFSGVGLWAWGAGEKAPPAAAKKAAPAAKADEAPAAARCAGRVLRPDGKPAAGAKVFFTRNVPRSSGMWTPAQAARGVAGPDGRFVLNVPPPEPRGNNPGHPGGVLLAVAPGYGPGWVTLARPDEAAEATVKLVEDTVPLEGR